MYLNPRIIALYDEYTHVPLARRVFLRRLAKLAGGAAAAAALLPLLENAYVDQVRRDDARLETGYLEYGGIRSYVARPKNTAGRLPAIVVIHENRGLNAHIEDVARRAANEGYLAIAPNALSALGKTFANEDEARQSFQEIKPEDALKNFMNVFEYLATRKDYNGKAGCV